MYSDRHLIFNIREKETCETAIYNSKTFKLSFVGKYTSTLETIPEYMTIL